MTDDNYDWFCKLEYVIDGIKIAVLFPWTNPRDGQMERSVGLFSERGMPQDELYHLISRLSYYVRKSFNSTNPGLSLD